MGIGEILKPKRDSILRIAQRHGVGTVRVFGSTPPWFPGGLVAEWEELLNRRVDVVEPEALNEELRRRVLTEAVAL